MNKRLVIAGLRSMVLVLSLVAIVPAQAIRSEPGFRPASNAAAASSGVWMQMNPSGFGNSADEVVKALEVFSDTLYAGTANYSDGGQIWRTSDGTDWTVVSARGFGSTYTNTNTIIPDMIEFKGQLYAGAGTWGNDGLGGQIWRCTACDGSDWALVVDNGFGSAANSAIASFGVFSDTLYAATFSSGGGGSEIWRSSTGDSGSWTQVVANGNGSANNYNVNSLTAFSGYLYADVENTTDGMEIWRTADGTTWDRIATGGFGAPTSNQWSSGLVVLGSDLYVGTGSGSGIARVYRSSNGSDWSQVGSDGFGDSNNVSLTSLSTHDAALYAGTDNATTGMEVWRSMDGTNWSQVNTDGFGDSENTLALWNSAAAVFDDHLYIGTANNADGGEVWAFYDPAGTWSAVTSPVGYVLNSVAMASADDGWAVGYYGRGSNGIPYGQVILRWDGDLWTDWWDSNSDLPLFSVSMVSASDGWIVGSPYFGLIKRWDGSDWNSVTHPTGQSLKSVSMVSSSDGWAVGGGGDCMSSGLTGTIIRWDGSSWSQWQFLTYRVLNSVAMVSANDGWAVGRYCYYSGSPPATGDSVILHWNGSNWSNVSSPTHQTLNSVDMVSGTDGWAVGDLGVILHWNGSNWSDVSSPTSCTLRSVSMISSDDGWAVGGGGSSCASQPSVVLHWDGSTWSEVASPASEILRSVTMLSDEDGWAVGEGGTILHYATLDKQVRVIGAGTTDYDWNWKTEFAPGDPIRWFVQIQNDTGGAAQVELTYDVKGPDDQVVVYEQHTSTIPAGTWYWGYDGTVPEGMDGTHTLTGSGLFLGTTSQAVFTYTVTGPAVYLPLVLR